MYVCMYVRNKYCYRNAIMQTYFLWAQHCFHVRAVEPEHPLLYRNGGVACSEAAAIRATCTATQKSMIYM